MTRRNSCGETLKKFDQDRTFHTFRDHGWHYEGEITAWQMKANRYAFVKDVSQINNATELRRTYNKYLRRDLKKGDRNLRLVELERHELPEFMDVLEASNQRNAVVGRQLDYYEKFIDAFGDKVKFLGARVDETDALAAATCFVVNGRELACYIGGMRREYKAFRPNAWLLDQAMAWAIGQGIERVNMFWFEGKFENNSLLEFKSRFGGEVEEYIGGFEKILRPVEYQMRRVRQKTKSFARRLLTIQQRRYHD